MWDLGKINVYSVIGDEDFVEGNNMNYFSMIPITNPLAA